VSWWYRMHFLITEETGVNMRTAFGTIDQVWVAPTRGCRCNVANSSISGWQLSGWAVGVKLGDAGYPLHRHVYAAIWRVYLHTYLQPRNRRQYSASITIQLVV
jgi:hypothetical protein